MKLFLTLKIAFILILSKSFLCEGEKHGPGSETIKELVHSSNEFAFKLLNFLGGQNEESKNENVFFSPTSISIALAMVYLGARRNTATQISDTFGWNEYDGEEIHTAFKTLHEAIHNSEDEVFELKLANRIWGHDSLQPLYEFSSAIKEFYGSEITLVDFVKGSDEVRKDVNDWVHQQTNGKIQDFLPHGVLNSATKLALINAIYFNGAWKNEFDKEKTFHAPFYATGNRENKIEVNMMTKKSMHKYYFDQEHHCHLLELPYSGDELSMVLVLPEELDGISRLEKSLSQENLDRWMALMVNTTVSVSLPRFKLNQRVDLKNVLPKLGINDVFDASKADLSGITENGGLFVSNVIHKAHVDVNERGTEAAAATGVTMMKRSLDFNEGFHADHPFIFFIRHHFSGSILFVGKLMQPSGLGEEPSDLPERLVRGDELSLFKRSSTSKNELKTNRGNLTKTETLHSTKAKSSTSVPTECDFERKCDPTLSSSSSIESLDDDDFYPIEGTRNIKRHNSLKRSRASLIFPRNSICCQDRGNLREKARTFCGVQDFLALESSPNITEGSDFDSQTAISERRRESCLVKEKKRSVSLVVPLSSSTVDFVHYHLTDNRASLKDFKSFIKTDSSHLRYQRASINNIRSISKRMSMSAQSFANIPSLGVTYVNNDGVENTLVILSGNASQSCYNLFKENERIHFPLKVNYCQGTAEEKVTMGNQQGSRLERSSSFGDFLEQGGTLKATSSTPDLYRAAFSGYTLTRAEEVSKKNMSHMMKGWSLKRHTLTINPKNHDPPNKGKKHRKLFGLGSHHQSKDKKGWTNESNISEAKCKSLSRSVDCLSEKPLPIRRDYKGLFRPPTSSKTATKMEQRAKNCSINCESDYEDASQVSKDSGHDSTTSRPLPMPRGSQLKALDSEDFSAPASFENGSVFLRNYRRYSMGVDGSNPQDSPLIPRMSTLERERSKSALTYPNDPQFPPAVRPRIQSLEELSPVEAEVILRKKKSFASRKTRAKHSLSMPTEELLASVDLSDDVKRYSFGEEMSNFSDAAPVPLTAYKSFSTEFLTSQESLDTINSSSEMGSTTSITSEKLLSPPIFLSPFKASLEDISKSPTIEEEPSSGLLEPDAEKKKTSLSRNPRLGRSTGDLSFELSSTLRRQRDEESMFEEMDVPEAFAEALWDHVTMDPEELSFKAGDIITVISMTNVDWWFGQVGEMVGWFPAPFVRVRVSQELDEIEHQQAQPVRTRKFTNEGLLTKEVVRARVVNELLETEKAYVKNIKDVVEGYLKQAQKRDDMFSEEELYTLFSNIEEIYAFHKKLLAQMKNCYVKDDPCASQIGAVFLANKQGFSIYSEYCNNHPQAIAEFKTLNESNKYKHFFEACRLLQGMINISLDGFLLTPVQKICKYPLQLAELLKHTHPSHPDFEPVSQALKTMKDVAGLINERKRKVESINKIARWQGTIEGWEGDNVLERSSELFCSGEVYKVSNGTTQERICFLFDHQLIYCKKDILRKNALTYKGRIDMDLAIVEWLEDGQETHKNEPLNNAWKIYNSTDYKWYVVYTKKPEQKEKWKLAFEKERTKVNEKVESGLEISQSTRRAVMRSASSSIKGKKSAAERREKYLRSVSQTDALKSPPSPTLRLPPPVSSEDFIKEDGDTKESVVGFLQRTSALRRSFGLRGSKRSHKDKRTSSVF